MMKMYSTISQTMTQIRKVTFAGYRLPDGAISDNGTQYRSYDFPNCAADCRFEGPPHPQANGLREVLLKQWRTSSEKQGKSNVCQALLAYRARPLNQGMSPTELLPGRTLQKKLPVHPKVSKTKHSAKVVENKMKERQIQKSHTAKEQSHRCF